MISNLFLSIGSHLLPEDVMSGCNGFVYCFASWASQVTTGLFWALALISFGIVIFLASARYGGTRAFGFTSFVLLIGGIWLSILKLIAWWLGSLFIIIGVIGLAALILNKD